MTSKAKGNAWEREICKFLGDTLGGNFQRVPNPGCYYVYSLWKKNSDKPFYIGKGKGERFKHHFTETKENTLNIHKFNVINSEAAKGEPVVVKILCENVDEDYAYSFEEYLISYFGRYFYDEGGCLTNICLGNRPPSALGRVHTEETKAKIRGPCPEKGNHGEKNGFYGKTHSEENKKKFSVNASKLHKGVKKTEAQKEKMKWKNDPTREADRARVSTLAKKNLADPKFKEASRLSTIKRNREKSIIKVRERLSELKIIFSLIDQGKSNIEIGKILGKPAQDIWHNRAKKR